MAYIVIMKDQSAFVTDWYSYENCWSDKIYCVINNSTNKITFDGQSWDDIEMDHL